MTCRKKTMLHVLKLDPCKVGSMEEYLLWLAKCLKEEGWAVTLVFEKRPLPILEKAYVESGAGLDYLGSVSGKDLLVAIYQLLRKHKPEVVHFHFCSQFSLLPVITKLLGIKSVFFTDHIRIPLSFTRWKRIKLLLWDRIVLGGLGIRLIAVSENVRRVLEECYEVSPRRIKVVQNGINLDRFTISDGDVLDRLRRELGLGSSPVIVCASNHRPEKGIDVLVRAVAEMLPLVPRLRCIIVGDGPGTGELKALARELRVEHAISFPGLRSDVQHFMQLAHVVVVPSRWQEPAGLVVIEAMAASKPVVASKVGGIQEYVVDGETGYLVGADDHRELARAVLNVVGSVELGERMGRAGRERVERSFSMSCWVDNTVSQYRR